EENSERCLGGTAAEHECRRVVQVDLDMGGEEERRPDVVSGANELVEPPAKNCLCFRLVDRFELSRSHSRSPSLSLGLVHTFSSKPAFGAPTPGPEPASRRSGLRGKRPSSG